MIWYFASIATISPSLILAKSFVSPISVANHFTRWWTSKVKHWCKFTLLSSVPQKKHTDTKFFISWIALLVLADLSSTDVSSLLREMWSSWASIDSLSLRLRESLCLLYAAIHDLWNTALFCKNVSTRELLLSYGEHRCWSWIGNSFSKSNCLRFSAMVW